MTNLSTQKRIESIITSLSQGILFELTDDSRAQQTVKGLSEGYQFIIDSDLEKYDMGEREFFQLAGLVNQQPVHLSPEGLPYRQNSAQITSMPHPPHPSVIPSLMNQVFYLTSDESPKSGIEKAAICQGGVFAIQPLDDGNKRVGRVMADRVMIRNGLNIPGYESREEYIGCLEGVYRNIKDRIRHTDDISDSSLYEPLIDKIARAQHE